MEYALVSSAVVDTAAADEVRAALELAGIRVWREGSDIWPGDDRRAGIRQAVSEGAVAFLALFSRVAVAVRGSPHHEELLLAVDALRRCPPGVPWLIPVRVDDCEIPDLDLGAGRTLRSLQTADLFGRHEKAELKRLVDRVRLTVSSGSERASSGDPVFAGPCPDLPSGRGQPSAERRPVAYLSQVDGGGTRVRAVHQIFEGESWIGRSEECEIAVPVCFGAAGRRHAMLTTDSSGCWLTSVHENGTYIDDKVAMRNRPYLLDNGAWISLAGPRTSSPARCVYKLTRWPLRRSSVTDKTESQYATVLMVISDLIADKLMLDRELDAIDHAVLSGRHHGQVAVDVVLAVDLRDLEQAIVQHAPSIVHFSGLGGDGEKIALAASDSGGKRPASAEELGWAFGGQAVDCVVLSACFTVEQGTAIAEHVTYLAGTPRLITPDGAIAFSAGFYQALADGLPVGEAFARAADASGATGLASPAQLARHGAENMLFTS